MIREEATELILEAKKEKELTFEAIAQKVGAHKVWTTAALLGQHPMSAEQADTVVDLLAWTGRSPGPCRRYRCAVPWTTTCPPTPPSTGYTR